MPYSKGNYGDLIKILTLSPYSQDYSDGIHPAPPGAFYLVDESENYITDESGNFIQVVL